MKVLVTGGAGFIGFHLIKALLDENAKIINVDNINSYYDPELKKNRLNELRKHKNSKNYEFIKLDISDGDAVKKLFDENNFEIVVNLAAQAGVRYSLKNPQAYMQSNMTGFLNILEGCRNSKIKHLIYASSSSVYGMNTKQPFSTKDSSDQPISLYAATKKSNELMAYAYSHLFKLPATGLRFFTVYGPWGRPDMAYYGFTEKILNDEKIDVYNNGLMKRDFTYIDDIVKGIMCVINKPPNPQKTETSSAEAPHKVYNIGNNKPVELIKFIDALEISIGKKSIKNYMPMQAGDVTLTYADIDDLVNEIGYKPDTKIEDGISEFVKWYKKYYKID